MKFNFFLKTTSLILIFIHLFFWITILYLCYFWVHYWLTGFFLIFERNWLYYLLFYLKILFVYNFYISLFFDNTTLWWVWLLITPYETAEEVGLLIFSDHGQFLIIETYDSIENLNWFDPTVRAKRYVFSWHKRLVKQLLKPNSSLILFNRRDKEYMRHFVPNQWNNYFIKDYGCLWKNNYFLKYKLFLRGYFGFVNLTIYPNALFRPLLLKELIPLFTSLYTCDYRVFWAWNKKNNKKVIKKYKFK